MCGRYTLFKLADLLKLIPWLQAPAEIIEREGRYNVAPSLFMPIATAKGGRYELRMAQWGFVPSWTIGVPKTRPINARAESVATSGLFRRAFQSQRCLIPADGFYEWKGAKPPKQPFYIRMRDGSPFAFAGLWSRWHPEGAEPIDTYTILTTAPNELMPRDHYLRGSTGLTPRACCGLTRRKKWQRSPSPTPSTTREPTRQTASSLWRAVNPRYGPPATVDTTQSIHSHLPFVKTILKRRS
jgi:putative SOS response-associated peptidase YedK